MRIALTRSVSSAGSAEPAWYRLLCRLAGADWISGQALAQSLSVSRAAVWKQVEALKAMGATIECRKGKGYRLLAPRDLLDADAIQAEINGAGAAATLHVLPEVDSTNSWLLAAARAGAASGTLCLAERQLAGRGRRGRPWVSPVGGSLCLSSLWRFDQGLAAIGGLSLAVGVALARALGELDVACTLKWPNDVLRQGRKLAGILIEGSGEAGGAAVVVIGVGINVTLPPGVTIDQPWADLSDQPHLSRSRLAATVIRHLLASCAEFQRRGLAAFAEEWRSLDALAGSEIRLQAGATRVAGRCRGIDAEGRLLVDTPGGSEAFVGGDVSVVRQ